MAGINLDDNQLCAALSADCCAIACRVIDALNQAICQRCPSEADNLIHHSDRGSQYLAIKYTERLAESGIDPSVGSVGDSYDNALAESTIGPPLGHACMPCRSTVSKPKLSTSSAHGKPWVRSNGKP
ncbi:MAG: hypothetical protein COB40_12960 [Marinosulfonomonas sp.]|nr:MAG: hypothetical protein COB40_12960 [Marinosulfonomonas sp.]